MGDCNFLVPFGFLRFPGLGAEENHTKIEYAKIVY